MGREELYLLNQALVMALLYITGQSFIRFVEEISIRWQNSFHGSKLKKTPKGSFNRNIWRTLLAYPTGLAMWGLIGYTLLVFGVPYNRTTILLSYILIYSVLYFFYLDTRKHFNIEKTQLAQVFLPALAVFFIACLCCSGLFGVSVSNDSYYYYSLYPQTIVREGAYIRSFDVFLTDVGQTAAIIGALPWLFGFEETYGIQILLGLNLVAIFGLGIFEMAYQGMPGKAEIGISKRKLTAAVAVLASIALMTATPFVVMTRWVLANIYFMTFFFIAFLLTIKLAGNEYVLGRRDRVLVALYIAMLSMLRMEGGMLAGLLILCACSLKISNKVLLLSYAVPVAVTQSLYYAVVFLVLRVDPLYSFLSLSNVFIMLIFIAAIILYLCFIRGKRLPAIQENYTWLLLGGLVLGNVVLALVSTERYVGNLRFMLQNVVHQNGWGYFAFFVTASLLLVPMGNIFRKDIAFPVLFTAGYALFTIALCWARNGTLREGIGDSGNRVLMQIVPFVIYTLVYLFIPRDKAEGRAGQES